MLNSDPVSEEGSATTDAEVRAVLRSRPTGAMLIAGIATAVVVAIWFAFYLLVFVARAGAP
jgi:hypothetical protein